MREVNDRFNEELATLTEENARERILNVGTPSPILLACGIEDKPIRLYGAKLLSKVCKHGYKIDDLKNLPLAMNSPIAVFEGSKKNSFAILTELRICNNNVLAALSAGKGGHDVDFNIISSVYDKRENSVARWVNDGRMLWVDKKKALDYFSVSAPLAEAQNNQELISTTKVIQNFPNPKIEARDSLITPEMDAPYIEVVHWHYVDNRGIEKIKRQAEREDGQLLILPPNGSGEVGALSDLTLNMSSESKDTTSSPNMQEKGTKFSLRSDVADILNDYDNDGVKYGSMLDVADGIEAVIAESTEDTTELENILNDFRAAQDDARKWAKENIVGTYANNEIGSVSISKTVIEK